MSFLPPSFSVEVAEEIYEFGKHEPVARIYDYYIDDQLVTQEEFEIALGHATLANPVARNFCIVGVQR